jgi:erythromycin esterase-like protein
LKLYVYVRKLYIEPQILSTVWIGGLLDRGRRRWRRRTHAIWTARCRTLHCITLHCIASGTRSVEGGFAMNNDFDNKILRGKFRLVFLSLLLLIGVIGTFLSGGCGVNGINKEVAAFAAENHYVINSTTDLEDFSDLDFLLPVAENNRVILYGESPHGTREHLEMIFRMLVFLNQKAGYRYFAPETDFAYSELLNRYLECGDPALLDEMDIWTYYNAARTKDHRQLWEKLYLYNQKIPHEQRIVVIATDISHGVSYAVRKLGSMVQSLPEGAPREELTAIINQKFTSLEQLYQALVSFEETLAKLAPQLRPIMADYEQAAFYVYSTRRSVELAYRQDQSGFDWNAEREAMIKEYFRWYVSNFEGAPEDMRIFAWNGAAHVTKVPEPHFSYEHVGVWLDKEFDWSRGKVFSIYAGASGGEHCYGSGSGMKTASVGRQLLDGFMKGLPGNLAMAALFTRESGKDGQINPIQKVEYNGALLGDRYDLLIGIRNVTPAEPIP